MYGVCLYSDAERYTTLSEGLAPEALANVMNTYYETLFRPVREQQGIISDIVGDAMLAIWTSRTPDEVMRRNALQAAAQIDAAVNRMPRREAPPIPATRLGLHSGEILLGSIGSHSPQNDRVIHQKRDHAGGQHKDLKPDIPLFQLTQE